MQKKAAARAAAGGRKRDIVCSWARPARMDGPGTGTSEVPGDQQLGVARRLPAGAGAEGRAVVARLFLVARAHVDHFLVVEQVVDRQAHLQVGALHRQLPGHAGADVVDPRHAAEGAARRVLVLALGIGRVAVGHADPAGAAAAALAGVAGDRILARPGGAEGGDRATGHGGHGAAEQPLLVEAVAATQLDLVAVVVEQVAVALVVGRVVPVLDHAGIAVVGVGVDRALVVARQLGPQVGGVERPLVVPGAVDLELHALVCPL